MTTIATTYDGEVFRPTDPVDLPAGTAVSVTVIPTKLDDGEERLFLTDVMGIIHNAPPDWSANPEKYLDIDFPIAKS